jgi:hypothetical protein
VVSLNLESKWAFSSNTTFYGYLKVVVVVVVVVIVKNGIDTGQRVQMRSDQINLEEGNSNAIMKRERQETSHSYQSMRPDRYRKKRNSEMTK